MGALPRALLLPQPGCNMGSLSAPALPELCAVQAVVAGGPQEPQARILRKSLFVMRRVEGAEAAPRTGLLGKAALQRSLGLRRTGTPVGLEQDSGSVGVRPVGKADAGQAWPPRVVRRLWPASRPGCCFPPESSQDRSQFRQSHVCCCFHSGPPGLFQRVRMSGLSPHCCVLRCFGLEMIDFFK